MNKTCNTDSEISLCIAVESMFNVLYFVQALKGIPREAYYIATKVGRYELDYDNMFDFTIEKTRKSLKKSLELLGVNYVDVI